MSTKLLFLVSVLTTTCRALSLTDCLPGSADNPHRYAFITLHVPDHRYSYPLSPQFGSDLVRNPHYHHDRPTVLYIHGFQDEQSPAVVVAAYLQRNNHNVLALDWSRLSTGNYLCRVVPNGRAVANLAAHALLHAFGPAGIQLPLFHVVGHSMGAQIAGIIGRELRSVSDGRVWLPRISALDPANPPFYWDGTHLRASDARFVDVIHTDAWLYGAPVSTGTVDFWPNGGKTTQPGCGYRNLLQPLSDNDFCSHRRSWWFWAESLNSSLAFPAIGAASWSDFQKGAIGSGKAFMGLACSYSARGNFYLQTNGQQPYGRSYAGTQFLQQ